MDPQRRLLTAALAGGTAATLLADAFGQVASVAASTSGGKAATSPIPGHDGRHDFDFFHGHWHLHNRRLKTWLAGSSEWTEFEGQLHCRPVLDGIGNVDELTADFGEGIHGISLRLYDPATRQWSDYWASKRNGLLNPPVVGAFVDGVGTFHGDDEFEGRPVRVRAIWTSRGGNEVDWEQAFSIDQGKTWETNWTMRMVRQACPPHGNHMSTCVEIRSYALKPGTREDFDRIASQQAIPMLRRWDVDVVAHGPSPHDDDSYYLIRAYASLADRQQSQDAFYGSQEWKDGPRATILALIESFTSIVLELDPATVDALRVTPRSVASACA